MITGFIFFIYGLMFFVLGALAYSVISKLTKKGRQSRGPHRKPEQEGPHGRREVSDYLDVAHSERIRT